jgi:hypothetical protein
LHEQGARGETWHAQLDRSGGGFEQEQVPPDPRLVELTAQQRDFLATQESRARGSSPGCERTAERMQNQRRLMT